MSGLPEWLWPLEDEQAVQEAERLIEETHITLQRMEADMQVQKNIGQHLPVKSVKLKSALNNKILSLEKELKSLIGLGGVTSSSNLQPKAKKLTSDSLHSEIENKKITKQSKILSKVSESFGGDHQNTSLPVVQKTSKSNRTTVNTAEKEVLTAREKVQDALAVARNVSASLDQHVCAPSVNSKPQSSYHLSNVGIFEIKSHVDKNAQVAKFRLEQAHLPSITIKRELEKQSIPSFQVPPGEKVVPVNVSVCNVKHTKEENKICKDETRGTLKFVQKQHAADVCLSNSEIDSAIVQLSKQLAQVEELREINQTQVNHVLRFLLSRVCASSPSPEGPDSSPTKSEMPPASGTPATLDKKITEVSSTSVSPSSSENSHVPIAYDSLSRFLETYKKAAEQNMLSRKRALMRRHRESIKQKKEIHQNQNSTENHLLIGPLRKTVKLTGADLKLSDADLQSSTGSLRVTVQSHQAKEISENRDSSEESLEESRKESNISFREKEESNLNSNDSSKSSSHISLALLLPKPFSGDEYEDDWEEEDLDGLQPQEEQQSDSSVHCVTQVDKQLLPPNLQSLSPHNHSPAPGEWDKKSLPSISANHSADDKIRLQLESKSLLVHEQPLMTNDLKPSSSKIDEVLAEDETPNLDYTMENPNILDFSKQAGGVVNCVNKSVQPNQNSMPVKTSDLHDNVGLKKTTAKFQRRVGFKQNVLLQRKTQVEHFNSSQSSSDTDANYVSRNSSHNATRKDLKLREDIQLQSAMLLNWQLEERWKNRRSENDPVKEHLVLQTQQREVIADVEKRWQQTLDQLDQRLKTIEDNDRIHRIINEIRMQSRELEGNVNITETTQMSMQKGSCKTTDNLAGMAKKISMKDQIVQTSPEKNGFSSLSKELEPLPIKQTYSKPEFLKDFDQISHPRRHQFQGTHQFSDDLTSELLAYSRMGILAQQRPKEPLSKSPSSSTASSHLPCSSGLVSLSDGELRDSASGSCSCSEGEFCMCGGRKHCSERAPPDGSYTFSDGENFLKDVSQGEIPPSQIKDTVFDTSHGEIGLLSGVPDLDENGSLGSDSIEWEPR